MNDTIELTVTNGQPTTTSLVIADRFSKRHADVLRSIENLECSSEFTERNFALSAYRDSTGRALPMHHVTKDGFMFLAMGFTGKEAAAWKERFIAAFNGMEAELLAQASTQPRFAPGAAPVQFLSHGADILVAADRTFRGALRSARSAGLPLPRALRRANEICLARTGLDMLTELDAHDQLTPPTAATQTTPGHLQAQVAEFAAALAAGEVSGAVLPMLTTQLYRFYTWWCRANQVPPASQVRFAALMVQGGVYHPRRKRYTNPAGEAVGPMAVAMPAGEGAPPHQHEPDWLGQHIARATQALANLNA